jgi:hypothetical protein
MSTFVKILGSILGVGIGVFGTNYLIMNTVRFVENKK